MTEKKRMGRPVYEPSAKEREQVRLMSAMGIPDYDIAKIVQLSAPTLRKHFWQELEVGHIESTVKVAHSLFKQATDPVKPNVTASIFWLKCRAGWREDAEQFGKKEQARTAAATADSGTSWDGLLQ